VQIFVNVKKLINNKIFKFYNIILKKWSDYYEKSVNNLCSRNVIIFNGKKKQQNFLRVRVKKLQ
jgi:hypothetical protein